MNVKPVLVLSGCYLLVSLLLVRAYVVRSISPRGLGVGLAVLFLSTPLVLKIMLKKGSVWTEQQFEISDSNNRKRIMKIRVGQVAVLLLGLVLLNGILEIGSVPTVPFLIGMGMNVGIMVIVIRIVLRLRKLDTGA